MLTYVQVYEDWRNRLGETALETVKAITMLGKKKKRMLTYADVC
jgi:hypothetical protein